MAQALNFKTPSGHVFQIDQSDAELLANYNWFARSARAGNNNIYIRGRKKGARDGEISLAARILDLKGQERCLYRNCDTLDLRRENLVVCTQREITIHSPKKRKHKQFKGVFFDTRRGKWWAQCEVDDVRHWGGYHESEDAAARAYNELAVRLHKEFALLNEGVD